MALLFLYMEITLLTIQAIRLDETTLFHNKISRRLNTYLIATSCSRTWTVFSLFDADLAAKSALLLPHSNIKLPFTDFKLCINSYLYSRLQSEWNTVVYNKLHSVKPFLGEWRSVRRIDRKEGVVL